MVGAAVLALAAGQGRAACRVKAPPRALGLAPFYAKYCSADGVPVVGAAAVSDAALRHAAAVIAAMLAPMPRVRDAIVAQHTRFGVIGVHQRTTDMPEYEGLPPSANIRARGFGATPGSPLASTAEENILCYEQDRWHGESILVHEFAHTIKNMGLDLVVPGFRDRVAAAFAAAIAAGKYRGLYASTNPDEYWAEGVQDYFGVHQQRDPHDINTRAQLATYDPALYAIIDGVFHDVRLPAVCPAPAFARAGWYRIESVALGRAAALDDDALDPAARVSGQYWRLEPLGGGAFRLTNWYLGPGQALDVANDGVYEPRMAATGNYSGQVWTIVPITAGRYRLTSAFRPGQSLEAGGSRAAPVLRLGATVSGEPRQAWTIRRIL